MCTHPWAQEQLLGLPADDHSNNDRQPSRFQDFGNGRTLLGDGNPERGQDDEESTDQRREAFNIW